MSIEYKFRANIDQVFALLTDAEYLVDRCLELGELSADCTVEDSFFELFFDRTFSFPNSFG